MKRFVYCCCLFVSILLVLPWHSHYVFDWWIWIPLWYISPLPLMMHLLKMYRWLQIILILLTISFTSIIVLSNIHVNFNSKALINYGTPWPSLRSYCLWYHHGRTRCKHYTSMIACSVFFIRYFHHYIMKFLYNTFYFILNFCSILCGLYITSIFILFSYLTLLLFIILCSWFVIYYVCFIRLFVHFINVVSLLCYVVEC